MQTYIGDDDVEIRWSEDGTEMDDWCPYDMAYESGNFTRTCNSGTWTGEPLVCDGKKENPKKTSKFLVPLLLEYQTIDIFAPSPLPRSIPITFLVPDLFFWCLFSLGFFLFSPPLLPTSSSPLQRPSFFLSTHIFFSLPKPSPERERERERESTN